MKILEELPQVQPFVREQHEWKTYEKFLFRITCVFFLIMCIPTNLSWYAHFFEINWTNHRSTIQKAKVPVANSL